MTELQYQIRECRPGDMDEIMVLIAAHTAYEEIPYNPEGKKEKLTAQLFSKNPLLYCKVAIIDGRAIGYATYTFDISAWDAERFINLDCLYLEECYRGHGIGKALFEKVREAGQCQNCISMRWHTPDFNVRAIKFYQRMGGTVRNKARFNLDLI
jgi:GNAT superfamily N-acetyltransferase